MHNKKGCGQMNCLTNEQRSLVEKNHNLIYSFARYKNLNVDDYYDILAIGICNAAIVYNEEKGKFSTIAFTCMETILFQQQRHERRQSAIPDSMILSYNAKMDGGYSDSEDSFIDTFASKDCMHDTVEGAIIKNELLNVLTEREREIAELLYNGFDTVQIATLRGCSKQNISYCVKKMRKKLKDYLNRYEA